MVCSHDPEPSWHQGKHLGLGAQLTLSKSGTHPILASWHLDKSFELSFYLFRNMSSEVTQLCVLRAGDHGDSVPSESPCLLNGHKPRNYHQVSWLHLAHCSSFLPIPSRQSTKMQTLPIRAIPSSPQPSLLGCNPQLQEGPQGSPREVALSASQPYLLLPCIPGCSRHTGFSLIKHVEFYIRTFSGMFSVVSPEDLRQLGCSLQFSRLLPEMPLESRWPSFHLSDLWHPLCSYLIYFYSYP